VHELQQPNTSTQDSQSASLNLSKVAGIFYILIAGMIFAMAAACGELLYRARSDEKEASKTHKSQLMQVILTCAFSYTFIVCLTSTAHRLCMLPATGRVCSYFLCAFTADRAHHVNGAQTTNGLGRLWRHGQKPIRTPRHSW
jgi:hypothetical protein